MDLRDKPNILQRCAELLLRFRLILLLVWVVAYVFFAPGFSEIISYVLGATERFAMTLSGLFDEEVAGLENRIFFMIGGAAIIFILRLFLDGIQSAVIFAIALCCVPMLIFVLDGSEEVILYIWGVAGIISFIVLFAVKYSFACAFVPLYFLTMLFTGYSVVAEVPRMVWGSFMVLICAEVFTLTFAAGKELSLGTPVTGSITRSFKKQFFPMLFSALALVVVMALHEMNNFKEFPVLITMRLRDGVAFGLLICFGLIPFISFTPLNRLRAKGRRVRM
jgi:hypothetical protein